ncbi:conserved hypothetical protein [Burkholderia diffusa]|nr:conserved hypothetical protein [Burkholderia diffusa]
MSSRVCPHCHTSVPSGARVCTGCQAEVSYGAEPMWFGLSLVPAGYLGFQASKILPESMPWGGWVVGVLVFVGLVVGISFFARDRVVFKRIYKTQR